MKVEAVVRHKPDLYASLAKIGGTRGQSFVPLYARFFNLHESNFNTCTLGGVNHLESVSSADENDDRLTRCLCEDGSQQDMFFKYSPLLDPLQYMGGKYAGDRSALFGLPDWSDSAHPKIRDPNNSAYVDAFFTYLSHRLLKDHGFLHGIEYYGSLLCEKSAFKTDVEDEFEYLVENEKFRTKLGIEFKIPMYEDLLDESASAKPKLSITSESVDCVTDSLDELTDVNSIFIRASNELSGDVSEHQPVELTEAALETLGKTPAASRSSTSSNCSSRSSVTTVGSSGSRAESESRSSSGGESASTYSEVSTSIGMSSQVEIEKFPVQLIAMERLSQTLDDLGQERGLGEREWGSIVFQILMTLDAYQKCFAFTHNDLHTNNIMIAKTDIKHLTYKTGGVYYRIPTFGRLVKIIDFGRAIYDFMGQRICSDSYNESGDAAGQYNCPPYQDSSKERVDPNPSFDLCRLGCALFDMLVDKLKDARHMESPIHQIMVDWCLDDKGRNVMYKASGKERYPDFKLYKMIARSVSKHTPGNVLGNSYFDRYIITQKKAKKSEAFMDIDGLPKMTAFPQKPGQGDHPGADTSKQ